MSTRNGQILTIGLVVIGISLFVVFTYVGTIRDSSVLLFDQSSLMLLENFVNAAEERNDWLVETWDWADKPVRRNLIITTAIPGPGSASCQVTFGDCSPNCMGQIVVTDTNNNVISSSVIIESNPGLITISDNFGAVNFYVLHYEIEGMTAFTCQVDYPATLDPTEQVSGIGKLCEGVNDVYAGRNINFNCSYVAEAPQQPRLNHSVIFKTPNLEFEGVISSQ